MSENFIFFIKKVEWKAFLSSCSCCREGGMFPYKAGQNLASLWEKDVSFVLYDFLFCDKDVCGRTQADPESESKHISRIYLRQCLFEIKVFSVKNKLLVGAISGLKQFLEAESFVKNDEKCFLFHLKSSFRSVNVQHIFVTFLSSTRTAW